MSENAPPLLQLIAQSFSDPPAAAKTVYARRFDRGTLWSGIVLVTVLSVLLVAMSNALLGVPVEVQQALEITPFAFAFILGASLVILVFTLYFVGKALGGEGAFPETVACVVWVQILSIAMQLVQLVCALLFPPFVGVVTLVATGLLLYVLTHFINELHRFDSLLKAFGTFAFSLIGIAIGLSVILALVGVSAQGLA